MQSVNEEKTMDRECRSQQPYRVRGHLFWGSTLIFIGTALLLDRQGVIELASNRGLWAVPVGLSGVFMLLCANKISHIIRGLSRIALACWLYACLTHAWGWTFATTWPVILVIVGVSAVARSMLNLRQDK